MRILYVRKPSPQHSTLTTETLTSLGMIVERCFDGVEALAYLGTLEFDCIVVSESVADMTTAGLIHRIRQDKINTPIIVRCDDGCGDSDEAVEALNAGADDYILSRYSGELVARIHAVTRRSNGRSRGAIEVGPFLLDLACRQVFYGAERTIVHLTGKEYALFELLAFRRGRVVPKDAVISNLYHDSDEPEAKIVDVFICKLRKKLAAFTDKKIIENVWGRGYMIPAPSMSRTERINQTGEPSHAQA